MCGLLNHPSLAEIGVQIRPELWQQGGNGGSKIKICAKRAQTGTAA
jgi:hypothetical protein